MIEPSCGTPRYDPNISLRPLNLRGKLGSRAGSVARRCGRRTERRPPGEIVLAISHPESIARDLLALLPVSPDAYPQKLDLVRDAVLVIRFDAAAYRAASFLDDRILGPDTQGAWIPVGAIGDATSRIQDGRAVHFIFHTGHVGSTLVSRLLDEIGDVLSLREPLPLRSLADAFDVLALPESLLSVAQFGSQLAICQNCGAEVMAEIPRRREGDEQCRARGGSASRAQRRIAGDLHESARRAVSRRRCSRARTAVGPAWPRPRHEFVDCSRARNAARAVA